MSGGQCCSKCLRWLLPDCFHRNQSTETGRHPWCKECRSAYNKGRRVYRPVVKQTKEELRRKKREYYQRTKEVCCEYRRKYDDEARSIYKIVAGDKATETGARALRLGCAIRKMMKEELNHGK